MNWKFWQRRFKDIQVKKGDIITPSDTSPSKQKDILTNCEFCQNRFKGSLDTFIFQYCGRFFCSNHYLPENHNCDESISKLKAPPGHSELLSGGS